LLSGNFLVSLSCPRRRASSNPCPFLVGCRSASIRGQELLDRPVKPGDDSSEEENREQAGWGGAVPGAGGMARDTGTCSSARIEARNCSIRTLPLAPPALSTPAGGTRRPSAPPGTSLRNATHLNSRSCFVLTRVEARVKATSAPAIASGRQDVFDAPAQPLNPPYSPPKKASFQGAKPCCCGARKDIDRI
jgi:hypothetical protein